MPSWCSTGKPSTSGRQKRWRDRRHLVDRLHLIPLQHLLCGAGHQTGQPHQPADAGRQQHEIERAGGQRAQPHLAAMAAQREKIKTYPAEKLENLVMSVAKEHLRTIELFGALFGFVIGVLQSIQFYFYAK